VEKVASLYAPVQRELEQVEAALDSIKQVDFPMLSEMLGQVLHGGGKKLRPALALLAGCFGEYRPHLLVPLATSIEVLHTAALVHDDVIDEAPTRRGRPTANSLFTNAPTVMLGDYLFAEAADRVTRTGSIEVIRVFSQTLMAMTRGELGQDMSAFDHSQTTASYFQRIGGKTASLFSAATEGGAIISEAPEAWRRTLRDYGHNLGMAFQIVDDILDFTGDEEAMGKPIGSDLMQGTLTLPSLLLLERYPKDNPIERLFRNRKRGEHLAQAIDMITKSDIIPDSYRIAREFGDRAAAALEPLPPAPARTSLAEITEYVLERRS
jgi:octaprenyl-diphosphate synthase